LKKANECADAQKKKVECAREIVWLER